uniref:Uncharacterized protein n=1 Tax=Cacopsylla melanoneura TaxID=428564 RepID=A0A8D8WUL9_9HEMI
MLFLISTTSSKNSKLYTICMTPRFRRSFSLLILSISISPFLHKYLSYFCFQQWYHYHSSTIPLFNIGAFSRFVLLAFCSVSNISVPRSNSRVICRHPWSNKQTSASISTSPST